MTTPTMTFGQPKVESQRKTALVVLRVLLVVLPLDRRRPTTEKKKLSYRPFLGEGIFLLYGDGLAAPNASG